jgi:hypothetical protein
MADAASPASPLQQEVVALRQRVAELEAAPDGPGAAHAGPAGQTWPKQTLLVNSILTSENRSPFSKKHYTV